MKSLFDKSVYEEVISRLDNLHSQSQRKWGKMEVAQMLAHCKAAFMVPLSEQKLPTAPQFLVKDQRSFETEKQQLAGLIEDFYTKGPDKVGNFPHPFFGTYTKEQWGKSMYKHLDHHLTQFGV